MSTMGIGYWLSDATLKYIKVERHEISAKDPNELKKLGLDKHVIQAMELAQGDEDAIRLRLMRFGVIRVRDYSDGLHIQFYKARANVRKALEAVRFLLAKEKGIRQAWTISIENISPDARDHVVLDMPEFLKKMDDDQTVMKESKK